MHKAINTHLHFMDLFMRIYIYYIGYFGGGNGGFIIFIACGRKYIESETFCRIEYIFMKISFQLSLNNYAFNLGNVPYSFYNKNILGSSTAYINLHKNINVVNNYTFIDSIVNLYISINISHLYL